MNDRKYRVLLNAQRLFIKKGFTATSVQDILDESHISKGTFYNYFSSKNECLMTILSHAQEITDARRNELMIGGDPSDKEIFAKQIAVRMEINREHQLIPLFEAIFHSKDPELSDFIKKHHMAELTWLSRRLVDLYGREAEPYALDGSIMVVGMFKHFINVWVSSLNEEINLCKLINFILCRTDAIMLNMIQTGEKLLGDRIYLPDNEIPYEDFCTKEKILERLSYFSESLEEEPKGKQYADFLINEIQSDHPRIHLIETVLKGFGETFTSTPLEIEAKELAFSISNFMSALQE